MTKARKKEIVLTVASVALGLFFIYAGSKKVFFPPAPRSGGPSTVPVEFIDLIRALKATGYFMIVVAWTQMISGLLLLWKKTRLLGALLLLPVSFQIFTIHLALDNRVDEYILTGFLFLINVLLILPYLGRLIINQNQIVTAE